MLGVIRTFRGVPFHDDVGAHRLVKLERSALGGYDGLFVGSK